jgi:hypothetical protein
LENSLTDESSTPTILIQPCLPVYEHMF